MKLRYAAAVLALAAPSSLAAQDIEIDRDQTLVENFDVAVVEEALVPFNATATRKVSKTGVPYVDIAFPGGLAANAEPVACKDAAAHTGCTGLRLVAYFGLPPGKTPADIAALVNAFNATHEATQAVYDQNGQTRLLYYVIGEFGITKTNLVVQIYNFRQSAQALSRAIFAKPAAAAAP